VLARVGGRADVVYRRATRQPDRRDRGRATAAGVGTSELTAASPEEAKALAAAAVEAARRRRRRTLRGWPHPPAGRRDEGVDRPDLSLPAHQDALIARVVEANPRTAVVLIAGSPVDMTSWLARRPPSCKPGTAGPRRDRWPRSSSGDVSRRASCPARSPDR